MREADKRPVYVNFFNFSANLPHAPFAFGHAFAVQMISATVSTPVEPTRKQTLSTSKRTRRCSHGAIDSPAMPDSIHFDGI